MEIDSLIIYFSVIFATPMTAMAFTGNSLVRRFDFLKIIIRAAQILNLCRLTVSFRFGYIPMSNLEAVSLVRVLCFDVNIFF